MFTKDKVTLLKDIDECKKNGYFSKLNKIYRKLPQTECNSCGACCYDPPVVSYIEFLYAFDYFYNNVSFTPELKVEIYKKCIKGNFYDLISPQPCAFLNSSNRCLIYPVRPLSCRRWGLQSKEENDYDWELDKEKNKRFQSFYAKHGIYISDERVNFRLPFCNNVRIVKNPYNFMSNEWDNVAQEVVKLTYKFKDKNAPNFGLSDYITYILLNGHILDAKIKAIRDYQQGNKKAIENTVDSIDYTKLL
jgi:Fe-S-cluster containining protein